jgi:FtsP/CotA-like multicopper oxidase with cupredoxin domain
MEQHDLLRLNRRELLKLGGVILFGTAVGDPRPAAASDPAMSSSCTFVPEEALLFQSPCGGQGAIEVFPTSPFILEPFRPDNYLPVPPPLAPVAALTPPCAYGVGQQASDGLAASTHSVKPADLKLPEPICYHITLRNGEHSFTNSKVQPIDRAGNPVTPPPGAKFYNGYLPKSTIFGFNGQFPGPMINARYGKPVVVRFENQLEPKLAHGNFGSPNGGFLTHLHNAHTAPESDGNPHFRPDGYVPGQSVDNLYLNYPAGGDDNEKQSFLWFHDHFEGYTGANVYKGLVGLYPIYDEESKLDPGDETKGLHLPGVRRNNINGTFSVDYDIPLAFYDCVLDDGVTQHQDFHTGCGETHPEWWGMTFFKHFPNHGFVGDIFTVNGKAFPVLNVKRRKYRFRFLDASIARVYEFKLMKVPAGAGPVAAPGTQGQWLLPEGRQCATFTQIASEGGLLPKPIVRDSFEIWPSRRKEVIVDFSAFAKGDVVYLVNIAKMEDGRKPDSSDPAYQVPVLKFVVGDLPMVADQSVIPTEMRPLPEVDFSDYALSKLPHRTFELQRGGVSGGLNLDPITEELNRETEWLINGRPFLLCDPLARTTKGQPEVWHVKNGGGGWVHPMHFHMEEHRIIEKNGVRFRTVTPSGPDDAFAKEDTISLGPGDEVVIYRNFRDFPSEAQAAVGVTAKYVAHCHNLAHEDHNMMFGWEIINPKLI